MNLTHYTCLLAAAFLALGLPAVLAPTTWERALRAAPRHRALGLLLMVIDLLASAYWLARMPLGPADAYKPALWVLTPLAMVLLAVYLDELLAGRALGGLLLLIGVPVLDAARWHPSPTRLVVVTLIYVLVVIGCVLVLSPYRLRDAITWATRSLGRLRGVGFGLCALGAVLLALGLAVY